MVIKDPDLFGPFCVKIKMDGYEVCETQENGSEQLLKKTDKIGDAVQHILNMRIVRSDKTVTLKEYYEFNADFNRTISEMMAPVMSKEVKAV